MFHFFMHNHKQSLLLYKLCTVPSPYFGSHLFQTPVSVIEIPDSSNECEEKPGAQTEEKSFISGLHSYMRVRGTPIERIPHLGFKQSQFNFYRVTTKRLWKRVYDELGGSPGSTSAATCTRKHYERLVLPYERHIKGEEDKPLPPTKPRKPYKRNADGKGDNSEGKKKRGYCDRNTDSQSNDLVLHSLPSMWTVPSDKLDGSKQNSDLRVYDLSHVLPVPTSHWTPHVAVGTGAGISPLEKKKRTAQASLNLGLSPQGEGNQRPSVILCPSPGQASSDGSPQPQSSSSSRSPSPQSVSSEDISVNRQDKPLSGLKSQLNHSNVKRICPDERKSHVSQENAKEKTGISSQPGTKDSAKDRITNWRPLYKGTHFTPFHSSSFPVKNDLAPASTSSFTKVVPKTVQLLRPAPIHLGYKIHQMCQVQDDSLTKKLSNTSQRIYQTEKWESSRSRLSKAPLSQHSLVHNLPPSSVGSRCDKSGRDTRFHSFHPALFPNRMRLPHTQLMYRHVPVSPGHPAVFGPIAYPYSYPMPHPGYTHVMPVYQHKH
uniref:AT rich interactive domain 5A (MRF1-like) n=1 Tax=Neogobius melanostomus TaxID=47308 RepID=A0A8C6WEG5_9GOBI